MRNTKKKKRIWFILFLLFLMIFLSAVVILFIRHKDRKTADNSYDRMQEVVNGSSEEEEIAIDTETEMEDDALAGIDIPEKNIDWDALHEENEDIYAWIYVPNTTVDYPVLQHPDDNSYYLNYNIDGSKGYPGCIYTENYNSKDFTDVNTVLYGHNLKDKTMFSTLHNFEDDEIFNQDNYIFIYTKDYIYVYQIFAAYEYEALHLLVNFDYSNEYVYQDYLDSIFENTTGRESNLKTDVEVTTEDKIITLSTCTSDHNSNYRYLVAGKLLNPEN